MKTKDFMYFGLVVTAGTLVALYIHDKWVEPAVKPNPPTKQ